MKSRKEMWLIEDKNNEEIKDKQGILNIWHDTRNRTDILDIENVTDLSEDEKGFPILMDEVELSIKEMKMGK